MTTYFEELVKLRELKERDKIEERLRIFESLPLGAPVVVGNGGDEFSNFRLFTYFMGVTQNRRIRVLVTVPGQHPSLAISFANPGDEAIKISEYLACDCYPSDPEHGRVNLFDENQNPRCPINAIPDWWIRHKEQEKALTATNS